ncbi:MAG: glycosyltransferase [Armatimonadetes bacterium]|nr:glycosyltransferase [Armatimonadota bacterium]
MALEVFVNASNMVGAGAMSLGVSLLPELARRLDSSCVVEVPDVPEMRRAAFDGPAAVVFVPRPGGSNELARMRDLFVRIPREIRRRGSRVCLTLGDIGPVSLKCPHVVFCQQALLVYEGGFDTWSGLKKGYLTRHFAASARRAAAVAVQTPVMAARLSERFRIEPERIHVIGQPAPDHVAARMDSAEANEVIAACEKPVKLLFLAASYPLKNHRILSALCAELKRRGMEKDVEIFLTLREDAAALRELRGCEEIVTNLGRLSQDEVAGALKAADALFLPTLLESYGLVYVEALVCGRPVITSDRDFARYMCGEFGIYFEPTSPQSAAEAIGAFAARKEEIGRMQGVERHLAQFPPDWGSVADEFVRMIREAC